MDGLLRVVNGAQCGLEVTRLLFSDVTQKREAVPPIAKVLIVFLFTFRWCRSIYTVNVNLDENRAIAKIY